MRIGNIHNIQNRMETDAILDESVNFHYNQISTEHP